mgnify:FL=1
MSGTNSSPTTQVKLVVGSLLAFVSQNVIQLVLLLGFDLPKETFVVLSVVPLFFFLVMLVIFTSTKKQNKPNTASGSSSSSKVTPVPAGKTTLERIMNDDTMDSKQQSELASRIVTNKYIKSKKNALNILQNRSMTAHIRLKARVQARKSRASIAMQLNNDQNTPLQNTTATSPTSFTTPTTAPTAPGTLEHNSDYTGPLAIDYTQELLRNFELRDANGDGSIEKGELVAWMQTLLPSMKIKIEAAQSIIAAHDENDDGVLQYHELEEWVGKLAKLSQKKRNKLKTSGERFGLSNEIMLQTISFAEELLGMHEH